MKPCVAGGQSNIILASWSALLKKVSGMENDCSKGEAGPVVWAESMLSLGELRVDFKWRLPLTLLFVSH